MKSIDECTRPRTREPVIERARMQVRLKNGEWADWEIIELRRDELWEPGVLNNLQPPTRILLEKV